MYFTVIKQKPIFYYLKNSPKNIAPQKNKFRSKEKCQIKSQIFEKAHFAKTFPFIYS